MKSVLILGTENEPHTEAVIEVLREKGANIVLFEPMKKGNRLTFQKVNGKMCWLLSIDKIEYNLNEFFSVWNRFKFNPRVNFESKEEKILGDFVYNEWRSLMQSMGDCFGLSERPKFHDPMSRVAFMSKKPLQLHMANKAGLHIPEQTIITNNYTHLSEYFENDRERRFIFKTLTLLTMPSNNIAITKSIDLAKINEHRLEIAPNIFQTQVLRDRDIRVTVVGNSIETIKIFCASIDIRPDTIDWRVYQADRELWRVAELDDQTKEKLIAFHLSTGLSYGAYDFIFSKDGPVFLECNPVGNWLWIEDILGKEKYNVTEAIANMLLSD